MWEGELTESDVSEHPETQFLIEEESEEEGREKGEGGERNETRQSSSRRIDCRKVEQNSQGNP